MQQQQQQIVRRTADRRMFSSSDDSAMMKQIQSTHAPDGRVVDVKPIMLVIEEILRRASPGIDAVINGTHAQVDTLDDKAALLGFDGMLELQALTIHKVSCELECKCSGGADAHGSTMAILSMLSSYTWDAKIVLSLAAFSVNYGQFWLVAQLYNTNPLAKSVAILKQLPDILEHSHTLKSQFDAASNLIKAVMDVTKCIIKFQELPSNYISPETPPMSVAMALVPTAAYWLIRSLVTCASQLTSLLGMSYQHITATTEAWEISSLAHKVQNIHEHLTTQLGHCHQHIDEKRHDEYFHMLIRLFETPHIDNMKILKALLYSKDDMLPLVDGATKTRVSIEVLRRKTVLLLISDLDISTEQLLVLTHIYNESRAKPELQYDLVWIPIQDRSIPWNDKHQQRFEEMQTKMPWYTIHHPTMLEPAVIKFIKEVWHFAKKQILVVLDPQGKVACPNALHMVWIWGNLAYPFTSLKEEAIWKSETWRLELLVDGIDPDMLDWVTQGKYICLYGGEDIDWIRRFTSTTKAVAQAAQIDLKMVYVGKHNSKDRTSRNITTIIKDQLSHAWTDLTFIWYFWTRLESMFYSKMQHGKTIENDRIAEEVLTMLTFDSSDRGWALFCIGSDEIAKAKGDTLLTSLDEFPKWEEDAKVKGFVPALQDHLEHLHTPLHCNRLILPGIDGGIPEMVICAECGRPMEKYFMYRCCVD